MSAQPDPAARERLREELTILRGQVERRALTELGNSERLVDQHGRDLRHVDAWGWLAWDGRRWVRDGGEVCERAKRTVRRIYQEAAEEPDDKIRAEIAKHAKASEKMSALRAMVSGASTVDGIRLQTERLDNNPWLLNCPNGTVDLRTGHLSEHRREDLITKLAAAPFDPEASAPRWTAFLNEVTAGDQKLVDYLQQAMGVALVGKVYEHALFFCYGTGRNGKSTFLNVCREVLGDYGQNAPPDVLMAKQGERHPTELARFVGARLVTCIEAEGERRIAEVLVKQLTGGDKITARFMGQDFFEFRPSHTIFLGANHKPDIRGTDTAIWSRIKLLPFTVTIPPERRDKSLPDKLLETESAGILAWMVRGFLAWQTSGMELAEPTSVSGATAAYRQEMDVLGAWLAECCLFAPDASGTAGELYQSYAEWCTANGERPPSQRAFGLRLGERGLSQGRHPTTRRHTWLGIGLLVRTHGHSEPIANPGLGSEPRMRAESAIPSKSGSQGFGAPNGFGAGQHPAACPECGIGWSAARPGESRRCLRGHTLAEEDQQ